MVSVDCFDVVWPLEAAPQIDPGAGEGNAGDEADKISTFGLYSPSHR